MVMVVVGGCGVGTWRLGEWLEVMVVVNGGVGSGWWCWRRLDGGGDRHIGVKRQFEWCSWKLGILDDNDEGSW